LGNPVILPEPQFLICNGDDEHIHNKHRLVLPWAKL
jgi:hypothetical protein